MTASTSVSTGASAGAGTVLLELTALDPSLRIEGHLPECDRAGVAAGDCLWCAWALDGAGIGRTLDALRDADALARDHDRRLGEVSVAWAVATGDLLAAASPDPDDALVPSVRRLVGRLDLLLEDRLGPLRRRHRAAVAADGPVERRCRATAAPLAATAVQRPQHAERLAALPRPARDRVQEASRLLSPDSQAASLLDTVESRHWDGLPPLRTQPEWGRRRAPDRPAIEELAPRGSLESLVVESVSDTVVDALDLVADDLDLVAGTVTLPHPGSRVRLSDRTRAISWRIARIDWHLTFADTGAAEGWAPEDDHTADRAADPDDERVNGPRVPWTVALAIEECERAGLVSATHRALDTVDVGSARA